MKTILFIVMVCLWHAFASAQTSLTFDGVDDYTHVNYYPQLDLGTGNFTLEAMLSTVDFSFSDTLTLFSQRNQASNQGLRWSLTNNAILFQIGSTSYSINHSFTGCSHLAIVRENGTLLFYANHLLLGTQVLVGTVSTTCINCDLWMGKDVDNSDFFKGSLDELRIWDIARSSANIASYELSCLDSTSIAHSNLVGYWNFEENTGQFANNLSSVAHYARLGSTFYADSNDPTWTSTSCLSSACYATGLADFTLSDNNPKEADLVTLYNNSAGGAVAFWCINGDTTLSVNSLQYTFPLGMNIIQLAVNTASGLTVRTFLLDVKRPKYPCGADELLEWRRLNDPLSNYGSSLQVLNMIRNANAAPPQDSIYYIPVVFHVIADNQARLSSFPNTRIQEQLDTLNAHFSKNNTNVIFCLAENLPTDIPQTQWSSFGTAATPGLPGITYTLDTLYQITTINFAQNRILTGLANNLPFKPEEYLSVYITDSVLLPDSTPVLGVSAVGPSFQVSDGIGIQYEAFVGGTAAPLGKVLIHEAGHWLGLYHVFDDGFNGDGICDTYTQPIPTQDVVPSILNCDSSYSGTICPPGIPYNQGENHMDYHLETCLDFFSPGQVNAMNRLLDIGRPFIHSELNLINTGVQKIGGCLDTTNLTASFAISANGVCAGESLLLNGAVIDYDSWQWSVNWDATKNDNQPMPTGAMITLSNDSGSISSPMTSVLISEPGIWDISLTVMHLDTSTGATIPITISDTVAVTILDCTVSDQRYRITTTFDSSDWQLSMVSIDAVEASLGDTTQGYILTGTSQKDSIEVGVLMQVDLLGINQWRKTIRSAYGTVRLFDVVSGVNYNGLTDCYALTGYVNTGNTTNLLFIITNKQGTVLYQENYPMENGGIPLAHTAGFQVIQLSSAFNNQFAIVGVTGEGVDTTAPKSGFIVGIDPTLGLGNSLVWSHFYESTAPTVRYDYDILESVVEIKADFGNGLEAALVVGGNSNRPLVQKSSGAFISCLTVAGQVVTQKWRKNIQSAGNNVGYSTMVAIAYGANRLFGICYSELSHGSFLFELEKTTGDLGAIAEIGNFGAHELLVDSGSCVISGRGITTRELMAMKVGLPVLNANTWNTASSAIIRTYSDTYLAPSWNGLYRQEEAFLSKPQNLVVSPNGGYMLINEMSLSPLIAIANGLSPIQLAINKLDNVLVSACIGTANTLLRGIITQIDFPTITDSIHLGVNYDTATVHDSLNSFVCFDPYCGAVNAQFSFQKCAQDSLLLTSALSAIGDYSYQWSPSIHLSNDTILEPITTTPVNQVYRLVITENSTGCQVSDAEYTVYALQDDTLEFNIPCLGIDTNLYSYNTNSNENEINLSYLLTSSSIPQGGKWLFPGTINASIDTVGDDLLHFSGTLSAFSELHYQFGMCKNQIAIFNLGLNAAISGASSRTVCSGETITFQGANSVGWTHQWFIIPPTGGGFVAGVGPNLTYTFTYDTTLSSTSHGYIVFHRVGTPCAVDSLLYAPPPNFSNFEEVFVRVYNALANISLDTCAGILNVSPNSPTDTIQWYEVGSGLITGATSHNYQPLTNGFYYATVTTDQCNFISDTFHYTIPLPIASTANVSSNYNGADISCYGGADGTATVTINNGLAPYSYLWSNGDSTVIATDLAAGSYQVSVIDACLDTTVATVNLTAPPLLLVTVDSMKQVSCFGGSDATIHVTGTGGTPTYSYLWSNGDSTTIATGLAAGVAIVSLTDNNGCQTTAVVTITEPNPISISINTIIPISCAGANDGQATAMATGGTMPYSYLWSNGETNATATQLVVGSNMVTITDAHQCTASRSMTLAQPAPLNLALQVINSLNCSYDSNGQIQVVPTGGTTPYTYQWSNGQSNALITGLSMGTYTVTVTSANNCSNIDSITLSSPALPTVISTASPVSCYGFADGQIATSVSGTTAPYSYLWSNNSTNATATGLASGLHSVTITDVNGCTITSVDTLTEPILIQRTISNTTITCPNGSDGQASILVSGGTAPYSYSWSNGGTNSSITSLTAGLYTVTVADANNCTTVDSINITAPTINSTANSTPVSCHGGNDGSVTVVVTGGTAPYVYSIDGTNFQSLGTFTNLGAGLDTITIIDANGCIKIQPITILEPTPITSTINTMNAVTCSYGTDGTIEVVPTGGTTPYTYQWSNGQNNALISGLSTGTYTVTIIDANNCSHTDSITLSSPALPMAISTASPVSCYGFADGQITTSVSGTTAPYSYLWSNNSTNATATGLASGLHSVTITDVNGCTITSAETVTQPNALNAVLSSTPINCISANSGSINSLISGGSSPYTYLWSNGASSQAISGLTAGTYCITVSDANGCTFTDCDSIMPLNSPLSIVKTVDKDSIVPYDTVCYRILVTNHCQTSHNIVVTDTLAMGLLVNDLGNFHYDTNTGVLIDTATIAAGMTDTLAFKVRVLRTPRCDSMNSILNQAHAFELGNPSQSVSDGVRIWVQDTFASNCTPLLDTISFSAAIQAGELLDAATAQTTNQTVTITGVWRVDPGTSYHFTSGSVVRMNPGAQIIVSSGASLVLNNATVRAACTNCMWQRILVEGGGRLTTRNNTILRDAQYAIQAADNSELRRITKTTFRNNFIGIYVAPNGSNNVLVGRFANNSFSASGIPAPFVGAASTPSLDINGDTVQLVVPPPHPTNLVMGLAGILAWDIPALNLNLPTATPSNTFQRVVAGIVLFNTNFSTNSCLFKRITSDAVYPSSLAYQGCGIHVRATGALGVNNILVESCEFNGCDIGISGIGLGIQAYHNTMSRISDMGIRSINLFDTRLYARFNHFTKMRRLGIGVFNPLSPSDIWIDQNEIAMRTAAGQGAGILINDSPLTGAASSLRISSNTLNIREAQNGIVVSNHNNSAVNLIGVIQNNTISMKGASPERAGISVLNSRLLVECNSIEGNRQTLNAADVFGIVGATNATLGGQSIYRCNAVDRTNIGVYFEGFNNLQFRGNQFDRHDVGLLLESNSIIGVQVTTLPNGNDEYHGNLWTGNTIEDARHDGFNPLNPTFALLSRFDVNSGSNPPTLNMAPNNIASLNPWFRDLPFAPNFDCNSPQLICGSPLLRLANSNPTNNVNAVDHTIANGGLSAIKATEYNGKRALFRKLSTNPNLITNSSNSNIQSFVTNHQSTCIEHFDHIVDQCSQALTISSIDSTLLDSLKNTCACYLDSLQCLDSTLCVNYTTVTANKRTVLVNNLSTTLQQEQAFLNNLSIQQQTALIPVLNVNNGFNTAITHEFLEKEVNNIYLNTLAKGKLSFSSRQLGTLRMIAAYCPQEGGIAVHQARGMLSRVEDVNFLDFDCSSNLRSKPMEGKDIEETISDRWEVVLYPNPTDDKLTIESNQMLENETTIEVYNSIGQQVQILTIKKDVQSINIDASSLMDGVYIMRLKNADHSKTKAFVVSK